MTATKALAPRPAAATIPSDRYLLTHEVAAIDGVGVTAQTVVDWILVGLVVPDETDKRGVRKKRVQLSARKIGGRWKVRESDAVAFINRITKLNRAAAESLRPVSESRRKKQARADKAEAAAILGG